MMIEKDEKGNVRWDKVKDKAPEPECWRAFKVNIVLTGLQTKYL